MFKVILFWMSTTATASRMDSLNPPHLTYVTPGESKSVNWKIQVEEKNRRVQFLCLDGASCLLKLNPSARLRFFLKPGCLTNKAVQELYKDVEPAPQNLTEMALCVRLENTEPTSSRLSKIGITVSVENLLKEVVKMSRTGTRTTQNMEVVSPITFVLKHAENNGSDHVVISRQFLKFDGGNKSGESDIWSFKINVSTTKVDLYNQVNGSWEFMKDV